MSLIGHGPDTNRVAHFFGKIIKKMAKAFI
jgi:hypothetical protein